LPPIAFRRAKIVFGNLVNDCSFTFG
jgi:hypothetical protein